ncbi:hypothetical protein [Halomicrobium katesii]|uniref:hypothetical protein n=1 Tax=Halomicrobium katesii TaxID=437163 RepID=UPI000367AE5B|nr:hypothetical protein [Halomicrobium katesii]
MSSDGPPTGSDTPAVGLERSGSVGTVHQLERRLLRERIEHLEAKLARERRQRQQIVEQYERLLDEERRRAEGESGEGLFEKLL